MPPKRRQKVVSLASHSDAAQHQREATRLRTRAESRLLARAPPPTGGTSGVASTHQRLRRADGADIVKRNATRRKKYLFVFPGGARLPAGGRVGELTGLDTRTPVLWVEFGGRGRLKMRGVLVFPRNGFVAVKLGGGRRGLQVVDMFETLVVFSEWAWVGDENVNPGQLPEPLPEGVRERGEGVDGVWKGGDRVRAGGKRKRGEGEGGGQREPFIVADDESVAVVEEEADEGDVVVVEESQVDGARGEEEGGYASWNGVAISGQDGEEEEEEEEEAEAEAEVTPRSNPRRRGKVVNYAEMMEDEVDDDGDEQQEGEDEEEDAQGADVEEEDPGYDLQADLAEVGDSD